MSTRLGQLLAIFVLFIMFCSPPAFSESCLYPGYFENSKNCGKYNKIVKQAQNRCKKSGNAIKKVDKKILRLDRRKERLLERTQLRQTKLAAKGLTLLIALAAQPCAQEFTGDLDDIISNFVNEVLDAIKKLVGLPIQADCIDELLMQKKVQKIGETIANMWLMYEYKTDRIEERIEDLEAAKVGKVNDQVCKCETIPDLIDDEYALKCP